MTTMKTKEKSHPHYCHSFKPLVDRKSRVLILGSMPGPEALRKQQYYGFNGNHFWTIIPAVLGKPKTEIYEEKLELVRSHGIALWDVLESCIRPGALDSSIREKRLNPIPDLLNEYRNIRGVFINGRTAHDTFQKAHGDKIDRPVFYLPSTSPAHAAMSLKEKTKRWSVIRKFLDSDLFS